MKLVFIHGWSVTDTRTYAELPEALEQMAPEGLDLDIEHIYLGKYISFHDEVLLDDVARAFEQARIDVLGDKEFSCITHSTGGPAIRLWAHLFYGGKNNFAGIPLRHLVMLAPANHGSALARLGKSRISRIYRQIRYGVEPGTGILAWLELGSDGQRELNINGWLHTESAAQRFYPFVITGQTIDNRLYNYIDSYLVEPGSDGVIRVCAANMNYRHLKLEQKNGKSPKGFDGKKVNLFKVQGDKVHVSPRTPFAVIPNASHTGDKIGIMGSVTKDNAETKPVVGAILKALSVQSREDYETIAEQYTKITKRTQQLDKKTPDQYAMVVFRIWDDRGNPVNDFDMLLLAGNFRPDVLPKGFFQDRQRNANIPNSLTYYINCTKMLQAEKGTIGIRINARPESGFAYYKPAEFRSDGIPLEAVLVPNETLLVDVIMKRYVDEMTCRVDPLATGRGKFSDTKPSGRDIE